MLLDIRGRYALLGATDHRTPPSERARLVKLAMGCARKLEKEGAPLADAYAVVLRASASAVRGRMDEAKRGLEAALKACESARAKLQAAAVRRCLGKLVGGDEGRRLSESAEAWMGEEGIKRPARIAPLFCPGFKD
jgi:hypothetical protein